MRIPIPTKKRKKDNVSNNACVEKRSMTRKVTAYCSRKRLLLTSPTQTSCSRLAHITHPHIFLRNRYP